MTEKNILYRCEQNFLNPDDESGHAVTCEDCGVIGSMFRFGDKILCADCIENRLYDDVKDACTAEFLSEYSAEFQEFISEYFNRIPENQEV